MKRLLSVVLLVLATCALVPATGASAAPSGSPLYDATLFCGPSYATQVDYSLPGGTGDSIWISTPGAYQGKWNYAHYHHYALVGALATAPVSVVALTTSGLYADAGGKAFGTKTGMDETADCEIVSRWPAAVTGAPYDFTIFGVMSLVRTG